MPNYNTAEYNLIYIFSIPDGQHSDILKVGMTSFNSLLSCNQLTDNCAVLNQAAHHRIMQETRTALVNYNLLHTELAVKTITMNDGSTQIRAFDDFAVRDVILNSGYRAITFNDTGRNSEWYEITLEKAIEAIKAVKANKTRLDQISMPQQQTTVISEIHLRDEQEDCVSKTINWFDRYDNVLWDCKMRFGKTVTAYELIRRMNEIGKFKKTIVITHRPAVEDGWDSDHDLIFRGRASHDFLDKSNGRIEFDGAIDAENDAKLQSLVTSNKPFVYFASIQDLRGSARVKEGGFNKNNAVYDMDWDLIIIDEAHEGTRTELGDKVIATLKKANTKILSLSGTPYNLIGEFEENKYTWTYVDEQKAKLRWNEEHPDKKNPYEELPNMNIFTFDVSNQMVNSYRYVSEDAAFNFREFFRTWKGNIEEDYREIPVGSHVGDFVHKEDVYAFLSLISEDRIDSNYPFSNEEFRDMFRHTFWIVPGVAAAKALSSLLKEHPRFSNYQVVNIAGDGDEEQPYDEALKLVKSNIAAYPNTITISCGKLTTGVTVREWTGIMMLSGSASTAASGYMQAIFRVQSPGVINGKQKKNCYVFDFAPDRTLKVIAKVHSLTHRGDGGDGGPKAALGEFLNFCPVIAVEGTVMRTYDVPEMMRQLKKISVDNAIQSGFDDDTIYKTNIIQGMDARDEAILKKLADVVVPQKKGKKQNEVVINNQGLTDEQRKKAERAKKKPKRELTQEEKELLEKLKKEREEEKKLYNLLRAVSIRLPLLFYGADADITEIIKLDDFVNIVDDESWTEFMPSGLRKELFLEIIKYYDEDVIVGAGLRIRKMSKAADELPPTFRVKRIIEILSKFKNPDKETVLTPWRVVNMHLGDTIGGYSFFKNNYKEETDEPFLVEQGSVTEDILLNPEAKILEMNSKSGLYPLYMAYSFYMLNLNDKEKDVAFEEAQKIWFDTVEKHIYVLCKTPMAEKITKRTLVGYSGKNVNTKYLTHLIDERMKDIPRLARKLTNPATWGKDGERMKFDAVVGNPPYQLMTGGGQAQATPLYDKFVTCAIEIKPKYISMIMPARWFAGGFPCITDFRHLIATSNHVKSLHDFEDARMCFPTVEIKGGVCYLLWSENHNGKCHFVTHSASGEISEQDRFLLEEGCETVIRKNQAVSILHKVRAKSEISFSNIVGPLWPYNTKSTFDSFSKTKRDENDVYAYIVKDQGWVSRSELVKNLDLIDKYKLLLPRSVGSADSKSDRVKPILAGPNTCCSGTYIICGPFDNENIAKNVMSYFNTKFFHFLLSLKKVSQDTVKGCYEFIPMQDFSQEITDKLLYAKYELDSNEISFIEENVWPHQKENSVALNLNYTEYVLKLLSKYGVAKHNYFKDTGCTQKNPLVSRTSEGLFCHHIDEDKAILLSNDEFAPQNPFEYQKADRLVYCNILEHLLLHIKIAEEPRNENANESELPGIGGAMNFIIRQINDYYGGYEYKQDYMITAMKLIENDFDDYIKILKHLWQVIENNPIYSTMYTKEDLAKGWNGNIVQVVLDNL